MMLVLGAGVAGISCALEAAALGHEVMLVTPGTLRLGGERSSDGDGDRDGTGLALAGGNTALAQGGIAAAIGSDDSFASHAADTIAAGAALVDAAAATQLCADGAGAVRSLIELGFGVDRDSRGEVTFGLEAAHSRPRIVHAGEDRTGAALHEFLRWRLASLVASGRVLLAEHTNAVSLLTDAGAVVGAVLRNAADQLSAVRAGSVVLATGGYAALYPNTSNHGGARGEGIVLAARVGASVADLEFVQFHPTVLAGTGMLISEALRGAGAVLRDESGARFMTAAHEAAELAPRDVVSREVHRSMRASGAAQVWLDATSIEREHGPGTLARRFPTITEAVRSRGIDWAREPVPVAPAAHYTMGGIVTDLDGRTSLPGLFAVGEVACTGVHGANRLASNSLLEGLVFGPRAAAAAAAFSAGDRRLGRWQLRGEGAASLIAQAEQLSVRSTTEQQLEEAAVGQLSAAVANGLGIERDADGLGRVTAFADTHSGAGAELAGMIAEAALARTESRGAHQRAEFAEADPNQARRRAWAVAHPAPVSAIPLTPKRPQYKSAVASDAAAVGGSLAC